MIVLRMIPAAILIAVAVVGLIVALPCIWGIEKLLGLRYEGFLTGKDCGSHHV